MRIPERYLSMGLAEWLGPDVDATGGVQLELTWPYPPFGYLRLPLFDVGNGDSIGLYWPLGAEHGEPIVCDMHHDGSYLEPEACNLEGLARLRVAHGWTQPDDHDWGDVRLIAETLDVTLPPRPETGLPLQAVPLAIVADSPALLRAHAQAAFEAADLDLAEGLAREALRLLPEFTDARVLLARTLRRARRMTEAVPEMIEAFCSPYCFGRGQGEMLQWLKRLPDDSAAQWAQDPLWLRRQRVTMATGVKRNDDFLLYEEIIEEYLRQGRGAIAVRLRVAVGELICCETTSFSERYGYSRREHFGRLQNELQRAGYSLRADALGRLLERGAA